MSPTDPGNLFSASFGYSPGVGVAGSVSTASGNAAVVQAQNSGVSLANPAFLILIIAAIVIAFR